MKVDIKFMRCEHQFGRAIMYGQLFQENNEKPIFVGSLAQIMQTVLDHNLELTNAQSILDTMVRINGFGV